MVGACNAIRTYLLSHPLVLVCLLCFAPAMRRACWHPQVRSVAVSADCSTVVSGSWDKTVRVWDVSTGDCRRELRGQTREVCLCARC